MIDYSLNNQEPFLLLNAPVVLDYSEYTGTDIFDVVDSIKNFKPLTRQEFNSLAEHNTKWQTQVEFYANSKYYIYDLLGANGSKEGIANKLNKFIPGIMKTMKDHKGKTFMEFGGGIGVMCELMKEWTDKKITYVDIASPITDFAMWRYKKYNCDIDVKIIPQDDFQINEQYSVIFTDAVWEHLPVEKQLSYATKLADLLEPGGMLVFIVDIQGESTDMPMHYNVNMDNVFKKFEEAGLMCTFKHPYGGFASVWIKQNG